MTPTAELADIVLPVTTPFESEALKIGFEYSQEAQSLVQLRQPLVASRGEARSDLQIVFDLATRLGLGAAFWEGDIEAAGGRPATNWDCLAIRHTGQTVPTSTLCCVSHRATRSVAVRPCGRRSATSPCYYSAGPP